MNNLTEEQQKFINDLAEKMTTQSNRATQYPLFVIQSDVKRYGPEGWGNNVERKDDMREGMCDDCKQKDESGTAPDHCDNCDPDCFAHFNWEQEFDLNAGVFLTEEACNRHVKFNDYHYIKPKSYVIGCWRNYETEELMKIVFALAGKEAPSCYQ